ncbi:MAG: nucleoside transporter C-terminal domain-containing protein [Hyphomicrobium aestuarii]|nr:nucleoside transporter C-terminal domain-containing protein [Hyphomicrobium aestuarii]
MTLQLQSALGLVALPALAWLLSERRQALRAAPVLKLLAAGIALQFVIAGLLLNVPMLRAAFTYPAALVEALQTATRAGVQLVFGHLAGAPAPYDIKFPANTFVLALDALPLVLVMSVLSKVLYHWGLLQRVVRGFAAVLHRTLGIGGAVGTSAAANVFMGNVEAPLLVRPYIATMTRAELFATMTVGMAGVAGTVLGIYVILLKDQLPDAAGHLIVASVISVPAALIIAALMVPEARQASAAPAASASDISSKRVDVAETGTTSFMDAVTQGTRDGVDLLVAITAMLIVAVALVTLVNLMLAAITAPFGTVLTLEGIAGALFAPLAFIIGIPWSEATKAGELIGVKTILNEFLAYVKLAGLGEAELSARSRLVMTYALCGFANFGSLGIMIGGLVAMAPSRRADILDLAPRTIIAGSLATLMTAAVVGVLTPAT